MASLADLHRAVRSALDARRIGSLVFVRYLLQTDACSADLPRQLTLAVAEVSDWIGQSVDDLRALGSLQESHVSLALTFAGGATALVSIASTPSTPSSVDLIILGNHGAIFHESSLHPLGDDPRGADPALCATIENALSREANP